MGNRDTKINGDGTTSRERLQEGTNKASSLFSRLRRSTAAEAYEETNPGPSEIGQHLRTGKFPWKSTGLRFSETNIRRFYDLKLRLLGRGTFGIVVTGRHRLSGIDFAVKIVQKTTVKNVDTKTMFYREIDCLRSLHHRNILRYYDFFEDDSFCYAILELCSGGDLLKRLKKMAVVTEEHVVNYVRQMLEAIHHCHERGIMHRDLKADNFLFLTNDDDSPLVLIDFGLALQFEPGTKYTIICGSPRYIAPEVFEQAYDEKCDLWSLGIVVYAMLYGTHPFGVHSKSTFHEIRQEVSAGTVPYPNNPGLQPPSLLAQSFLQDLLQHNPAKRPNALEAMQHPWLLAPAAYLADYQIHPEIRYLAYKRAAEGRLAPMDDGVHRQLAELQRMTVTASRKGHSRYSN
uniref:non-specific serine/threonine protein kinase n=1 Tax=Toxoplasma gondii COUG TaxID=1074873 RepID=A0A2G8Y8F7_TOXGO|nr:ULK kinase [Toxoplasma gondii COUG]